MTAGYGLLLAMMEPPAALEAEFNAWYDNEHLPERAAVDGFLTARRYVCIEGWPRYLALYDLDRVEALHAPSYLAVGGARQSAWSQRTQSFVGGLLRAEGRAALSRPGADRRPGPRRAPGAVAFPRRAGDRRRCHRAGHARAL
ncbi:MAG: hypothetical protein WDO24_02585 [Pseudomonadota bacterium]